MTKIQKFHFLSIRISDLFRISKLVFRMKVLFFGRYDPSYSRNRVILKGLCANGVTVHECRVSPSSRLWFLWLPLKYLAFIIFHFSSWRSYDAMFVAFPGQEVMSLARLLTRRPLIFDALTSHYEGYVQDRKTVEPGSRMAERYKKLDRRACELANTCLTDTTTHADWWAQEYGLPREKFHSVFVGTDTDVFSPGDEVPSEPFTVHFHGSYIPLQGADVVVRAAAMLKGEGVHVHMYGKGQTYDEVHRLADELGADNVEFRKGIPYAELAERIRRSDICLGIFGTTPKTQRVIPNKVYEALACRKPVITADTPAARELLDEDSAILVPPGQAGALADAIRRLKDDPGLREHIAYQGHDALLAHATPAILGRQVLEICENILKQSS